MRCAVLGDPIAHSLSPVLHRAGYAALGLDWEYDALRVPSGALPELLAGLGEEWRGLSLTMPLKREAMPLAATLTDRARLAGGANTLVRTGEGWAGDNTDLPGAMAAIRERFDGPLHRATILGGGATAASVGLALAELGVSELTIAVRDPARAQETVDAVAAHPSQPRLDVVHLDEASEATDILVTTVPAAAQTSYLVARCAGAPVLFEVVYDPWPTPLQAAAQGVVVSGLDLLVHQAVLQFELFTGIPGPLDAMRAAGEAALRLGHV
jgi:shikimate dehydrogenase